MQMHKKIISVLLVIVLMFTSFTFTSTAEETLPELQSSLDSVDYTENSAEELVLPDIIEQNDVQAAEKYEARAQSFETSLNMFVFRNNDGTYTKKIYSHPVKYIDDTGAVRDITTDIVDYINGIERETGKEIPVIAAGGIWDGKDIQKFLDLGASGVQMATRFVATEECDASEEFKQAYIHAKKEDIKIIKSPVGLPGRAIYNEFIKKTETQKNKIDRCYQCIKTCNVATTPYCITKALINAVKGNMKEALIFCGSNVSKVKEIISVHALMNELVAGMAS